MKSYTIFRKQVYLNDKHNLLFPIISKKDITKTRQLILARDGEKAKEIKKTLLIY